MAAAKVDATEVVVRNNEATHVLTTAVMVKVVHHGVHVLKVVALQGVVKAGQIAAVQMVTNCHATSTR